jgi:hypothetical protein
MYVLLYGFCQNSDSKFFPLLAFQKGSKSVGNKLIDRLSLCIETAFHHSIPYQEKIRTTASLGFSAYEIWYLDVQREDSGWVVKKGANDIEVLHRLNQELALKCSNPYQLLDILLNTKISFISLYNNKLQ